MSIWIQEKKNNMVTSDEILKFFKALSFNSEAHIYHVNDVPIEYSVSGKVKKFYNEFDAKRKSVEVAIKTFSTQQQVLKNWEQVGEVARVKGNKAHLFGELYPFNRELRPQSNYDIAIMKFWKDLPSHIVPVLTEARMYHLIHMYAGTADLILYNTQTGKYIIGDYKTNKDLYKNFMGEKMLHPFNGLLSCPYNHYQLQLSYYQILLEQIENIEVSYRKLIWLKADGNYELHDTEDYTEILKIA